MITPKINYAPNTVFIVQYETFAQKVASYILLGVKAKQKNMIIVRNGNHGNQQDEFGMPTCCAKCKEKVLAILN